MLHILEDCWLLKRKTKLNYGKSVVEESHNTLTQ